MGFVEFENARISIRFSCSELINLDYIIVVLYGKDNKEQQKDEPQRITAFKRLSSREFISDNDMRSDDDPNFLTLRLYYCMDLIEERYFKRNGVDTPWSPN
ncbi:MAG: hypothetical protein WAM14_22615 [Candidatus Nitrosopolaris sp.]